VSWCDGDNSQIDTIVSEEGIQRYSANNIIANKHNASGTGKEQANDLCKVFPISNQLNKTTTVEHISSSNHHLKRHLEEQFAKFDSKLRIKKKSAIIDFLAKQPTILSRACVRENILSGYVTAGLVDPNSFLHASFAQNHGHMQKSLQPFRVQQLPLTIWKFNGTVLQQWQSISFRS
jgi:hypothetical protein